MNEKTNSIISKYQNIADNFGLDVIDMVDEMAEVVEEKQKSLKIPDNINNNTIEVVSKQVLMEDFNIVRKILLEAIEDGRAVLKTFANELQMEGTDAKPGILTGYSEVVLSVNQNIKLLIGIYKDIVKTEVEMHKAKQILPKEDEPKGNVYIQNNFVSTTSDLISKYSKGVY